MFIKVKMRADPYPMAQSVLLKISSKETPTSQMLISVLTHLNSTREVGGPQFDPWCTTCCAKVQLFIKFQVKKTVTKKKAQIEHCALSLII